MKKGCRRAGSLAGSRKGAQSGATTWTVASVLAALTVSAFMLQTSYRKSSVDYLNGRPRLVSVQAFPETGPICELQQASAQGSLMAALQERRRAEADNTATENGPNTKVMADMKPTRWIRDPYAAFSSVAVDPVHNEVVMTDENLFNIMVYDRTANTPPAAKMSEPKRKIGGLKTNIEFQCGLYIDPASGDIYAVNNDTVDSLVIFGRQAQGDVAPDRQIHTPHGTFGIAVDEAKQELYLTEQHDSAVVVYHKNAAREDSPIRLLQGDHTGLADPHGIALDTKNQWMFITNHGGVHKQDYTKKEGGGRGGRGEVKENWPLDRSNAIPGSGQNLPPSITVHPLNASGDTPPLRTIQGPKTRLDWPTGLAVDSEHGELYVANDMDNSILVFNATDGGDVAPKRMIRGPKTGLGNPTGVWLDSKNDELWAANFMNHSATVYKREASGDVAPVRTIRSGPADEPALGIGNPHPLAYDTKREQILVPNCVAHPQIAVFSRLADGAPKPVRRIEGQKSLLGRTMHGIAYDEVHDEIVVPQQFGQGILTFAGDASGEVPPKRIIQGSKTRLTDPDHLAVDAVHGEIYVPADNVLLVYDRAAQGDVAPIRTIEGKDTGLGASAVGVDPINNLVIVSGGGGGGTKFRVFNRTDQGNVKPMMTIGGPRSLGGPFALYPAKKLIIATDRVAGELASDDSYLGIWSYEKDGNNPPLWKIGGPHGVFQMPRGVVLDVKNKSIIVSDKRLNSVLTFAFPDMF